MEFKLTRFYYGKQFTLGVLTAGGKEIGTVAECPVVDYSKMKEKSAIPEGKYDLDIRINPSAGVPIIKVLGKSITNNVSIRAMKSLNKDNASPYFCKTSQYKVEDEEGLVYTIDEDRDWAGWLKMLTMIELSNHKGEKSKLEIIEK